MITHIKKYWIAYLILVVVLIIIAYNWGAIKDYFMESENTSTRQKGCVCDDGREYPGVPAGSPRCEKGCKGLV